MNVLFSQIKKYLPNLKDNAKQAAEIYTEIGYMLDKFTEVKYKEKKDSLLDLEVRQNRADMFGVIGIARELSSFYNIPLDLSSLKGDFSVEKTTSSNHELPIKVEAKDAVKRVLAIKIEDLKVGESPDWLVEYLSHYDINSINNLVDVTNYIMLETGFPSHAFDINKMSSEALKWELAGDKYKKVITLNGEEVKLVDEALLITENDEVMSLGIIGGTKPAIDKNSNSIIVEIGVYDPGLIRRNGRKMNIRTEAGARLEKYLDPAGIDEAFEMLINMILKTCGGKVSSKLFEWTKENYTERPTISVDLDKVQQIAGMGISYEDSKTYLKRLGFEILKDDKNKINVKRPINRLDIEQEEDVFEEIIRLKGFYQIPTNVLAVKPTRDVTPSHLKLISKIYTHLPSRGFDEVRSWVLVDDALNAKANTTDLEAINVVNSINDSVPTIRQTLAVNIFQQIATYKKNNVSSVQVFEIGKVFNKDQTDFTEHYSLVLATDNSDINFIKKELESLLTTVGIMHVVYKRLKNSKPSTAHPESKWEIIARNVKGEESILGIIYVSNSSLVEESCIAEIDINKLDVLISQEFGITSAREILNKLVTLDTNLILKTSESVNEEIIKIINGVVEIWDWQIIDEYKDGDKTKYTVRVTYEGLSDEQAKDLHERLFQ